MTTRLEAQGIMAGYPHKKGDIQVLHGVDLIAEPGAITALLGPNGAGKSTLFRCLTGLLRPWKGRIAWPGRQFGADPLLPLPFEGLSDLGVLLESPGLYGRLTPREYLRFFARFHVPAAEVENRIQFLARRLDLDLDGKLLKALSQGNRRKVHVARALIGRPKVLLLDEPSEHLDPEAQSALSDLIRSEVQDSQSICVLASHRLEQMEDWADSIALLRNGRILLQSDRESLRGEHARLEIELTHIPEASLLQSLATRFNVDWECRPLLPGDSKAHEGGGALLEIRGSHAGEALSEWVRVLSSSGLGVLRVERPHGWLVRLYAGNAENGLGRK